MAAAEIFKAGLALYRAINRIVLVIPSQQTADAKSSPQRVVFAGDARSGMVAVEPSRKSLLRLATHRLCAADLCIRARPILVVGRDPSLPVNRSPFPN
ncbi:hypothetical protein GA830_13115 [Mesorhizobium sp. NBSH29]|nr:hypothetical protein GA830_13115 [Mesorhizobium sp. NBSH29]